MKENINKFFLFTLTIFAFSSVMANPNGNNLFNTKGCTACHQANADLVGPSLKLISTTYKGKINELIKFLKGSGSPKLANGKFANQYDTVMKLQLNQIKNLSDKEFKDLAEFLLSN